MEDTREAVVNESFNPKPQAPTVSHCSLNSRRLRLRVKRNRRKIDSPKAIPPMPSMYGNSAVAG
jgi:hypothetical protein